MRNSIILMVVAAATTAFASPVSIPTAAHTSVAATPTSILFPDGFTISVPDNERTNTTNLVATVADGLTTSPEERMSGCTCTDDGHISDQAAYEADIAEFEEWERLFKVREAQRLQKEVKALYEKAKLRKPVEKRDGARKHGVVCNVL